jgi:alanine-synthesizing transaminase
MSVMTSAGPCLQRARQMEEEGHKIIKLNIGNLAAFGFDSPDEIQQDMIRNLPHAVRLRAIRKGIFCGAQGRSCTTRSKSRFKRRHD